MKYLLQTILAGSALLTNVIAQSNPPGDFNEDVLIFTGEVQNYVDVALELKALNDLPEAQKDDKLLEEKVRMLQQTSLRVANMYFSTIEDSTRTQFDQYLGANLKAHKELKNYFLFIGNAFAAEAARLVEAKNEKNRKIFIWSSMGGAVLGLGGGLLYLKLTGGRSMMTAAIIGVGIGVVAAGGGYAARYILPVNQDVVNAEDFLNRYPHGEDFTHELIGSQDLALAMDDLEEASR